MRLGSAVLTAWVLALTASAAANAQSARPLTIPALREWTPAAGSFSVHPDSRILVRDASLLSDAEVFAEDLAGLLGFPIAVVTDPSATANDGDLALGLGETDPRLGSEGYRLRIGDTIEISAIASAGAFYGTRTVLQLLHQNFYQGFAVPAGEALDWPRYPERGLMIDAGRVYYTPGWIEHHIRELAYLKMNYFHLHFSDDGGVPDRERDPSRDRVGAASDEAAGARPDRAREPLPHHRGPRARHARAHERRARRASRAPARERRGPDPREPARHRQSRGAPVRARADRGADPAVSRALLAHRGRRVHAVDPELNFHPQLRQYARDHYGPSANACDAVIGFVNWANALVKENGKITRMWHDELNCGAAVVTEDSDIVVEWWDNFTTLSNTVPLGPNALLARGHIIENSGWFPTYYAEGAPAIPRADMEDAYEHWEVHQFAGTFFSPAVDGQNVQDPPEEISPDEPRNLGAKVNVWITSESEEEIALGIRTFLRVLAQKTWQSELLTPEYTEFLPIMDVVGHAPGYQLDARPEHTLPEPSAPWRALGAALGLASACTLRSLGNRTRLRFAR